VSGQMIAATEAATTLQAGVWAVAGVFALVSCQFVSAGKPP